MKKLFLVVAVVGLTSSLLLWYRRVGEPTQADLPNTLIVGTSADFPPFSFKDAQGNITGFDIAVSKEVAKRLNKQIQLEDMRFDMLLPELQVGHIHILAAGLTPTPERAKNALFTKPYISNNPLVILSRADTPVNSLEELKNKEVIVNTGYTADTYMSKLPDIKLLRLGNIAEALTVLEKGGAAAYVTASNTLKPVFEKVNPAQFHTFILNDTVDESSALAISQKYQELLPQVQKALDSMQSDGTLDALKQEWKLA